ncbi:MAG: cysteine desulfurase [Planctomyces sp.]|nr:cysteine desulfurase [Planctomyces sp.]
MTPIYLDHNASTPPAPEVIDVVARVSSEAYGNPGSRHAAGRQARKVLEQARDTVARVLDASPANVVFTSGGTEATNLAMLGLCAGRQGVVLAPPGEHPATEQTIQHLTARGFERWSIPIDARGRIVDSALDDAPWDRAAVATALVAHNETGVIQNLDRLSEFCGARGVPLHLDAVQAAGRIAVRFRASGAATMSIAAHKFRGPRGIGALLIREDVRLQRAMFGGHQESERRPGTESVALAAGMAAALELWDRERAAYAARLARLRDRLEGALLEACAPAVVNGSGAPRLPNTLNIAFPGCDGEALLVALDLAGVCASLGSACASGSSDPAPILTALGCPPEVLKSSLRLSVGWTTTESDVDEAAERIAGVVGRLRGL